MAKHIIPGYQGTRYRTPIRLLAKSLHHIPRARYTSRLLYILYTPWNAPETNVLVLIVDNDTTAEYCVLCLSPRLIHVRHHCTSTLWYCYSFISIIWMKHKHY